MTRTTRIMIVLVVVVFAAVVLKNCAQSSGSKRALAAYKASLRAKGEKLTAAELGFPRLSETNQSLALLLAAVNQIGTSKADPGVLQLLSFAAAGRAQVCWAAAQPPLNPAWGGNTNVSWEDLAAQFESNAGALQSLREAVENPPLCFFNDPTNFFNQPKSPFLQLRKAAQSLSGDAIVALHAHDLGRAQANIHALSKLAQFHREDLTLVSQMIRTAIAGLGLAVTWEALQAHGWTEESLAALQRDWESVDLADVVEKGMTGERAFGEAAFSYMRVVGLSERMKMFRLGTMPGRKSAKDYFDQMILMPVWLANADADETLYLEYHQRTLDALRKVRAGTSWQTVDAELKSNVALLNTTLSRPMANLRYRFSAIAIPNSIRAGQTCIRNETQRRLTITAIAVERYRLRSDKPPPDLDALVPQFLSSVPLDPMSGKPLRYRLNPDGSFALYSVGEDARDDGGNPSSSGVATNKFDLWLGKDAVWPESVR